MFQKKLNDIFQRLKRLSDLGYTCSNRCRKKITMLTPTFFFRSATDIKKISNTENAI